MHMKQILTILLLLACLTVSAQKETSWTGTFATAVEFTGKQDMPQNTTLTGNTLRQTFHVSIGGSMIRVNLSNEMSNLPVEIKSVYIADVAQETTLVGSGQPDLMTGENIVASTAHYLTFDGKKKVTIKPGQSVWSDPIKYELKPLQLLSMTIFYGNTPKNMTSHRGSRTTSYIAEGEVKPKQKLKPIEKLAHWYNISKIAVETTGRNDEDGTAIAILGNSITDGRGSTTDKQNRWPDRLAEALNGKIGILNLGIGGNCVVSGGISEPALKRFDRDILNQDGINRVIIFEGTNDIGCCPDSLTYQTATKLIAAYKELAKKAHARGLKVYGATITPTKGNGWYSIFHNAARETANEWIRTTKDFDGVIDFDALVRNPNKPDCLLPDYSDDWLHLNPKGYEAMGKFAAEKLR